MTTSTATPLPLPGARRPYYTTAIERRTMQANGIVCHVCLYYGLGHDGEHVA